MVGREESSGDNGKDVPRVCGVSESPAVSSEGISISQFIDQALASGAWSPERCPDCRAATEGATEDELYDAIRSGTVPLGCSTDATPCPFLYYRVVHRFKALRDSRLKVVDG